MTPLENVKRSGLAPLLVLLAAGAIIAVFAARTVHRRTDAELRAHGGAGRAELQVGYWLEHGWLASAGLMVFPTETGTIAFYRSSTGGVYLSGFLTQKIVSAVTGSYSRRAMAIHNQIVLMLTSALVALLAFRLVTRLGAQPLHALVLAVAVEAVLFTFPDNLMTYWEMSPKVPWLLFACLFLIVDGRPVAQAVSAFFLTYMELIAGFAFIAAYVVVTLLIADERPRWKRVVMTSVAPMLLAIALFASQVAWVRTFHPEIPRKGSGFLFRSGMDGASTDYYLDHLDIGYRRDLIRRGFAWAGFPNSEQLFRWKWLFFAGTTALIIALVLAMRGHIPRTVVIALLSLLGAYLICAAVLSQEVMIHPYFYDAMLFTPLVIALFAIAPAVAERAAGQRGIVVAVVFFVALAVAMMQLRRYAVLYPLQ